ncbi:serine/threonine-protein kinase 16 [Microplitis mediator]|uniref:serine/threonine-protein kinase 16 n=1 Tax=Microplitis demolitor TaxID=69319 RepID=UPI0004CC97C4|nr:serine/threonine-protein kinase 16 [Microplitis demolitor]XP_057322346.1 serine/threonine-protein kinase 16 [Microplitis mediator]
MNSLGLNLILKMGCLCSKETITVNDKKYNILEHLADGGFSSVYLVEDALTRRKYAIKKVICHSAEDQQIAAKEIEYHTILKHVNIIECIDSTSKGAADPVINATSQVLLVLPYYHKGTLAYELEKRSKTNNYFSPLDVLNIFQQICEGVKVFHDVKPEPLAHRDLKTANILLDDTLTPIIMDLGSVSQARVKVCGAQEAQTLQDIAAERCSMPYRAPELFNVESYCMIDERTDIWSLGCILYALCYFKSPFEAVYERGDSVALAVISANITFPENAPYNEDIQNLIQSMLKTNPMERPYIYSVIENVHDVISKLEGRV